jgi:DNA-binding CsgD family transcriptional regulator
MMERRTVAFPGRCGGRYRKCPDYAGVTESRARGIHRHLFRSTSFTGRAIVCVLVRIDTKLANMLEPLGLDPPEESLYLALLKTPRTALTELALELGLTEMEMRRALVALEANGLVARSADRNELYLPASPDLAIEALVHRRQEELKRLQLVGRQLGEQYRLAMQSRTPSELIEVLTGKDAVLQRADQLYLGLDRELLMIDRPPYRDPAGPTFDQREMDNLARGVTYRTLYHRPVLELPGYLDAILRYVGAGEQARVVTDAPFKLSVFDRAAGLLPINPAEQAAVDSVIVIHESPLLDAIILAFEYLWQPAQPIGPSGPDVPDAEHPNHGLDRRTMQILTLLAAGLKDAAIARQLAITERTVRRHVELLLADLQASTRFQAGAGAARRGLI